MTLLKPITEDTPIYARPGGLCYHLERNCQMLQGGDFERLKYRQITQRDIKLRYLNPCICAYKEGIRRQNENKTSITY